VLNLSAAARYGACPVSSGGQWSSRTPTDWSLPPSICTPSIAAETTLGRARRGAPVMAVSRPAVWSSARTLTVTSSTSCAAPAPSALPGRVSCIGRPALACPSCLAWSLPTTGPSLFIFLFGRRNW